MSNLSAVISPSILSSDFARLGEETMRMIDLGADAIHVDIMDGHFVPNLTLGPPIVKALRKFIGPLPILDCHLMVSKPETLVQPLRDSGASSLTVHVETFVNYEQGLELLKMIQNNGMKTGLALKPGTQIRHVIAYLELDYSRVDMVLVMTVEPGYGGQAFMSDMMPKVELLRDRFPELNIQVDGGIGPNTIELAARSGANVIVAGSSIYQADHPGQVIKLLRDRVNEAILNM